MGQCREDQVGLPENRRRCFVENQPSPGRCRELRVNRPECLPCSPGSARSDEVEGGVLRQIAQKFTPCVPRGAGYRDSGHGKSIRICT